MDFRSNFAYMEMDRMINLEVTRYDVALREFFLSKLKNTSLPQQNIGMVMSLFDLAMRDTKLFQRGLKKIPKSCKIVCE